MKHGLEIVTTLTKKANIHTVAARAMIVTVDQYEMMKNLILNVMKEGRKVRTSDCDGSEFEIEAMISLHSQLLLRQRKNEFRTVDLGNTMKTIASHIRSSPKERTSLLRISNELGIGGYKAAKVAVDYILGRNVPIPQIIENPLLITDECLRRDILECIMSDPLCSVECDQQKECSGKEYESLLMQQLLARNMCFETEAALRNRGKPKTPDILLLIPMGVDNIQRNSSKVDKQQRSPRPHVINWIDSKGMFADEETFEENYEQLKSYVNR
jgi:Protein of unknown function TPD sequence-motif